MSHLLNHPKPRRIDKKRIQRHVEDHQLREKLEAESRYLMALYQATRPAPKKSYWDRFR